MTFNPDNLIWFHLILAIVALAIAFVLHAAIVGEKRGSKNRDR